MRVTTDAIRDAAARPSVQYQYQSAASRNSHIQRFIIFIQQRGLQVVRHWDLWDYIQLHIDLCYIQSLHVLLSTIFTWCRRETCLLFQPFDWISEIRWMHARINAVINKFGHATAKAPIIPMNNILIRIGECIQPRNSFARDALALLQTGLRPICFQGARQVYPSERASELMQGRVWNKNGLPFGYTIVTSTDKVLYGRMIDFFCVCDWLPELNGCNRDVCNQIREICVAHKSMCACDIIKKNSQVASLNSIEQSRVICERLIKLMHMDMKDFTKEISHLCETQFALTPYSIRRTSCTLIMNTLRETGVPVKNLILARLSQRFGWTEKSTTYGQYWQKDITFSI